MLGVLIANLVQPSNAAAGLLALALGITLIRRLGAWHHPRIWLTPMLTVLYVGFS